MDFPITELRDEDACYAKLLPWLDPDGLGVHCRHRAPDLDYRCQTCHRVFNAFTDTVLQDSKRSVVELMQILRGFAQGVPTAQLARDMTSLQSTASSVRGTQSRAFLDGSTDARQDEGEREPDGVPDKGVQADGELVKIFPLVELLDAPAGCHQRHRLR